MTVRELISKKDYDYISFRATAPPDFIYAEDEDPSEFMVHATVLMVN